jgi:hypothetical protein
MSDFEDAIGDMTTDLLAEAGGPFVYFRGTDKTTVTMRKSTRPPVLVDAGSGTVIEVRPVDFIILTADLPYGDPQPGDHIRSGGLTWEVLPNLLTEKVFRRISDQMTRIHTKQVN